MPIPPLNEDGLLPDGIHDCTLAELEAVFGQNRWVPTPESETVRETLSRQRGTLCDWLKRYLERLRDAGLPVRALVDGSFVTSKPDPNDLDLIVVFAAGFVPPGPFPFLWERLLDRKRLREEGYPFDLFVTLEGDEGYQSAFALFRQVKGRSGLVKGLLRVRP